MIGLSVCGARGIAEKPPLSRASAHPLLAAVPALVSSTALTSPEKLAFIISQSEKTFWQLVRSPPHVNGTSLLLLSLGVGSWGIFFSPFLCEFLQG